MNLLYLTVLIPLISFFILLSPLNYESEKKIAFIGVGSVGLSSLIAIYIGFSFISGGEIPFIQNFWSWMNVGKKFHINISLFLDWLSLSMLFVVTIVGFFIHMFASWYMRGKNEYARFFAYTNLFIFFMLVLVLADNLILMYFGWEGVGLCSYLLIGFYYTDLKNSKAAIKSFIITRIGDVFLVLAIFILYKEMKTFSFHEIFEHISIHLVSNQHMLKLAAFMLLCGSLGKSAQFPLQTWLPDAMVGPTPVSALIHAATMVTAGVYLIARTYPLFILSPDVLKLISIVGLFTLLFSSCAALVQIDIKRILAYSTISQIGYMFLALGFFSLNAAIFHLIMHAFFKALLFLSSGSLILSCHHEQNIFKMGGLYKSMPLVYLCFLVGGSSLTALPVFTAGFYSKEAILISILHSGYNISLIIALIGSVLTALYTFRMIFIVFHGEKKLNVREGKGFAHHVPLIVLLLLSTFLGAMIRPPVDMLFSTTEINNENGKTIFEIVSSIIVITAVLFSIKFWLCKNNKKKKFITESVIGRFFTHLWFFGWGFDHLYNKLFVRPYIKISFFLRNDPFDAMMNLPVYFLRFLNKKLLLTENGFLRWYLSSIGLGSLVVILILFFLK